MDHAALRTLILATPAAAERYGAGDDTGCAAALNERTERGPVPIVELSAYCVARGIIGGCEVAARSADSPNAVKGLCYTVLSLLRDDWRLTTADVDEPAFGAAADGLVQVGLMTAEDKTALLAMGANRRSKAEATAGVGRPVTAADVGRARRLPA